MLKSTIIATCLSNSGSGKIEEAEVAVENIFYEYFSQFDYNQWNTNIPDSTAQVIINRVGRASRIDIKKFIEDLRE